MTVTIELPEALRPRTHIAARTAAEYVAHALGQLPSSAWPKLMNDGKLEGTVTAEYVGEVKWTVTADGQQPAAEPEETIADILAERLRLADTPDDPEDDEVCECGRPAHLCATFDGISRHEDI